MKINYYVSGDETLKPLRDSTVISLPTYTDYNVNEYIYRTLGEDSE